MKIKVWVEKNMKKFNLKRFLALVLAVFMMLSICSCDEETETKRKKRSNRTETETEVVIEKHTVTEEHTDQFEVIVDTIIGTNDDVLGTDPEVIDPSDNASESYNILVLGQDRAAMLTDVMMIVNVDSDAHSITVMQIPRDTYIANHNGLNIATNKINALFTTYYYKHYRSGKSQEEAYKTALTSVADDFEKALAVDIDFSAIMDLDGFRGIVDALGGVEINVSRPMYYNDPELGLYINIPAGYQTLNGAQAEGFVRFRYGYITADFGRQNAQKQFMAALMKKVKNSLSLSNVKQLTAIADQIITYVDTDMSAADLLYFGQEILKCDLEDMTMFTMPGNLGNNYYVMNRAAAREMMTKYFYRYKGMIPDAMFDSETIFNNPDDSYMDEKYHKSADQVFDSSVYDGESVENIIIH